MGLVERILRWFKRENKQTSADSVAGRFVRLFEAHGIHRNQIPRFFGHGISLADVKSDEALVNVLNEDLLAKAAELFSVRLEWLEGASDQIYVNHDFYKKPGEFVLFLERLLASGNGIDGILFTAESTEHGHDAFILLEETIRVWDKGETVRYYLCNNWVFEYWKARAYLTACVAAAWQRGVFIQGREVSSDFLAKYGEGEALFGEALRLGVATVGRLWHPEDMALEPEAFLKGLDEKEFGGAHPGLLLWLDLQAEGYMAIDELMGCAAQTHNFTKKLELLKSTAD